MGRYPHRRTRRGALSVAGALIPALTGCASFGAPSSAPAPNGSAGSASGPGGTTSGPAATVAPPTAVPPTPTPAPTPVPEPREYATADGWYYAGPGFAVRDEPGGPRFWTEFSRPGVLEALGLPASRAFDATVDGAPARVQRFRNGWLTGAPGAPVVRRGEGTPPNAPPEALQREDRPEMAFLGRVDVIPKQARQGQTVLLRIWSQAAQAASVTIENRTIELLRVGDALVGFFGVNRQGRPGPRPVRFTIVDAQGRRITRNEAADTVQVVDGDYSREELVVDAKTMALLDPVKMNQEDTVLNRVMGELTPEKRWSGAWAEPTGSGLLPVPLSSDFGILRSVNGGPYNWAHEGTDFEVDTGDPIRAVAAGRVVFTQELYVRGNTVVIDHGLGIYSMYNHMFKFDVQPGQDVKRGDSLGLVGSTGFVTGPHLHLEIRVHNQQVEPLEWLQREPFLRPDLAAL